MATLRPVPIDIDEFESADLEELVDEGSSAREAILEFLAYNPEQAYSREEIQSAIGVDAIHLLHELTILRRDGLVRHKGRYWAIAEDYEHDMDRLGEPL